jgi:hypothetical protein
MDGAIADRMEANSCHRSTLPELAFGSGARGRRRCYNPCARRLLQARDRARVFLLADVSRVSPDDVSNGELGIHLDYTLMPILRPALRDAEWERNRYLWYFR